MAYRVSVVIERDSYGYYAFSPEIGGCQTDGVSLEEVVARVIKIIEPYMEPCVEAPSLRIPA